VFLNVFIPPGSGGLQTPQDITVGPDNNLYVSSWSTGSVKRYDRTTGAFLGDFVASGSGGLTNPDQVIFGPDGNLYVSDRFFARVLRYDGKTGAFLGTFVQDDRLGGFVAFAFGPDGNLYASMFNGNPQCILRFNGKTGAFLNVFACAPDSSSAFGGIAFGPDNKVYASRFHKAQVWQLDSSGHLLGRCSVLVTSLLTTWASAKTDGSTSTIRRQVYPGLMLVPVSASANFLLVAPSTPRALRSLRSF
jgi:streptogramin lyase